MLNYYSINLDLRGKNCLVIGGGRVAERKVQSLVACEAAVTVISLELTKELEKLAATKVITVEKRLFEEVDLDDTFLVIGATNQGEVNERIGKLALAKGILVNIADNLELSNFLVPATHRQGLLSISVSTGGASPALAAKIRGELAATYGAEYAELLEILQAIRPKIIDRYATQEERKKVFARVVDSDILELIREGKQEKVKERIAECIY